MSWPADLPRSSMAGESHEHGVSVYWSQWRICHHCRLQNEPNNTRCHYCAAPFPRADYEAWLKRPRPETKEGAK